MSTIVGAPHRPGSDKNPRRPFTAVDHWGSRFRSSYRIARVLSPEAWPTDHGWRVVVPALAFMAGLLAYGVALGDVTYPMFDEIHYGAAASAYADGELWEKVEVDPTTLDPAIMPWLAEAVRDTIGGPQTWRTPQNAEHPPLAKWSMAGGIVAGGTVDMVYGARLASVLLGALGLAGVSVVAWRLTRAPLAAVVAPVLLMVEPMWYLHSRLAMLEVHVATPLIWAVAFALGPERRIVGILLGLALSAKLTALFIFPVVWVVMGRHHWRQIILIPLAVLVASYTPHFLSAWAAEGLIQAIRMVLLNLAIMVFWGAAGPGDHSSAQSAASWWTLDQPLWYGGLYAVGNPVIWWGAAGAVVAISWMIARRVATNWTGGRLPPRPGRTWHQLPAWGRPAAFAVSLVLASYAPYLVLSRTTFLYYMTGVVPWMVVLMAVVLTAVRPSLQARTTVFVVGAAALLFAVSFSVFSGLGSGSWLLGGTE